MDTKPDRTLDLRATECPFTVLELGKAVRALGAGDVLEILVERESGIDEIRSWCEGTGTEFMGSEVAATIKAYVRKP